MKTPNFDFMGKRIYAAVISGVLIAVAVGALAVNNLNMGLDFTGGTLVELGFTEEARKAFTNAVEIGDNQSVRESATKMLEALP